MIKIKFNNYGFSIYFKDYLFCKHSITSPFIVLGYGEGEYLMNNGFFRISENITNTISTTDFKIISQSETEIVIEFSNLLNVIFKVVNDRLEITFECKVKYINRFWFNILSSEDEKIYGCGKQYSELNLKRKIVPIWCEEEGIGRGKDITTLFANITYKAGGDAFTTPFPQPTFVSSKNFFCHIETTNYAIFDFTNDNVSSLYVWNIPEKIVIDKQDKATDVISSLTNYFGKQPKLPEWIYDGICIDVQGGSNTIVNKLESALQGNVEVNSLYIHDWVETKTTALGHKIMLDMEFDKKSYPNLPDLIKTLNNKGVHLLGYINPFLSIGTQLYKEASEKGYLVKNKHNDDYIIQITTKNLGLLDLSNPDAVNWIKAIIKKNLINLGFYGWVADFGEHLPIDAILYSEENAEVFHNKYPVLWAKINKEAIEESKKSDEIVFFSNSGHIGSSKYAPIILSGKQGVGWSLDNGLATVIPACISLGFSGIGIHSLDIGGYLTIAHLKRSKELFIRWIELSAFSIIMKTNEGSKPNKNWQFDSDKETIQTLSKMSKAHKHLKPYLKAVVEEYYQKSLPTIRHPYIHYEHDEMLHQLKYQYLLGRDLLVAPVYKRNKKLWKVYLPDDNWIHIWTGNEYAQGWCEVQSPFGQPPVFYRKSSNFNKIFSELKNIN